MKHGQQDPSLKKKKNASSIQKDESKHIRLDDLIPTQEIKGGRKVIFGAFQQTRQ
jgi:hypothetical protein